MDKSTASRLGANKPAKYVYQVLKQHHEYVRTHECPCCYAKRDSLIIEYSVISHVVTLSMSSYTYSDVLDILNDLEDMKLIDRQKIRDDLFELKLLQLQKPVKEKAKKAKAVAA